MRPDTIHPLREPVYGWRRSGTERECIFADLSLNLPLEASLAGMALTFELPPYSPDPIYLKNKDGHTLVEWVKPPSLTEIREVALRYL